MSAAPYRALTLAIHPSSRGFGWSAFSGPFSPFDWGLVDARGRDKNERCLRRVERLLTRLTPERLVLETFEAATSARRPRITRLGRAIVALAAAHGIEVAVLSYGEVRQCFMHLGAQTRWEIARALARQFPALARRLPIRRQPWKSEDWRLALFSAVALILASYQLDARAFVERLGNSG